MKSEVEVVRQRVVQILLEFPALLVPEIARIYRTRHERVSSEAIGRAARKLKNDNILRYVHVGNRFYWVPVEVVDRVLDILGDNLLTFEQFSEVYRQRFQQTPNIDSFTRLLLILKRTSILRSEGDCVTVLWGIQNKELLEG